MNWQLVISGGALLLSVISTVIAGISYRRSSRALNLQYQPRIQVEEERTVLGSPSNPEFSYDAKLVNKGEKPITVDWIWMRYGEPPQEGTSRRIQVEKGFHLSPGENRRIRFRRQKSEIIEMMQTLQRSECIFALVVCYRDTDNSQVEMIRPLCGYRYFEGELGVVAYARDQIF